MNTAFRNLRKTLMNKRRILVAAEMLCLVAIASAFLLLNPLAMAKRGGNSGGGGGGCAGGCAAAGGCAQAAAAAGGCAQAAAQKPKVKVKPGATPAAVKKATFQSIVTTVGKTSPTGLQAQLFNHITVATLKKNSWAWVIVTMKVRGKTETFGAEAFLNSRNQPVAILAEILPTSSSITGADTRPLAELLKDPSLQTLIKSGQQVSLTGVQ